MLLKTVHGVAGENAFVGNIWWIKGQSFVSISISITLHISISPFSATCIYSMIRFPACCFNQPLQIAKTVYTLHITDQILDMTGIYTYVHSKAIHIILPNIVKVNFQQRVLARGFQFLEQTRNTESLHDGIDIPRDEGPILYMSG